jgi:LysM repeat protein
MLPGMNMADPDASDATDVAPAEAAHGPSKNPGNSQTASADTVDDVALRGCPFLLAESGGWRLNAPSRDHRCAAVAPPAALSLEKQERLCLTAAHTSCATYTASMSARGSRIGTRVSGRTTRWALTRTTTVIEDAGGLRSQLLGLVLDRGRWPAIPAVVLVVTLVVLAISGLQGVGTAPVATASPTHPAPTSGPTARPSAAPTATAEPEATPTSVPPTAAPSPTPVKTAKPTPTFRTYRVTSGDTLSGIASHFGTTSFAIAALNGISVNSILRVGQVLKIPNAPNP